MESIKEVLKKVLSDDFIKECAEDFTKDGIEQLTGTMLGAVTKTFFEKWNYCRALLPQNSQKSTETARFTPAIPVDFRSFYILSAISRYR